MNKYIKVIKQEITWSKKKQKIIEPEQLRWFIKGLLQAIFLIKKVDLLTGDNPEESYDQPNN